MSFLGVYEGGKNKEAYSVQEAFLSIHGFITLMT